MLQTILNLNSRESHWYYAYKMIDTESNQVLLTGVATLKDIVTFQTPAGLDGFVDYLYYNFEILGPYTQEYEARNMMGEWLKNMSYTPPLNLARVIQRNRKVIKCNETNQVFRTQQDACQFFGISTGNMSNHLRHKPGFKTLKGRTFSYASNEDIQRYGITSPLPASHQIG